MKSKNPFKKQINLTELALAITKKNIVKGNYKPKKQYASNKSIKPKSSINKYVKNPEGNFFFIKGNMHEQGFKGLIKKSSEKVSEFLENSGKQFESLNL